MFFHTFSGEVDQFYFFNHTLGTSPVPYANSVYFRFLDPEYTDKKMVHLIMAINDTFNIENK